MRAIKFRAFGSQGQGMFEVKQLDFTNMSCNGVTNCKLMQFTGLLDKNGKEIYEGDIREGKYYFQTKEERGVEVMEWDNENSCFYWKPICGTIPDFIKIEVIGNIYENPELAGRTE